jgi:DNA-binding CsgD family transcriptional regulator
MRQWLVHPPRTTGLHPAAGVGAALAGMVDQLGEPGFVPGVLPALAPVLPAASWSVYRTGRRCKPTLFMSASLGVPDTTQDCWWAYLSGPYRDDRTWGCAFDGGVGAPATRLCHVTAQEVEGEHRARVYDAHGVAERVSVAEHEDDGSVFAVNFYRHQHQKPFGDSHIGDFEALAPVLLALARKHIMLSQQTRPIARPATAPLTLAAKPTNGAAGCTLPTLRTRLLQLHADLTDRELDVCARLLQGMTHEGIASDLGLGVPTVKTYRNRAFARLGIHFRNELFARVLGG